MAARRQSSLPCCFPYPPVAHAPWDVSRRAHPTLHMRHSDCAGVAAAAEAGGAPESASDAVCASARYCIHGEKPRSGGGGGAPGRVSWKRSSRAVSCFWVPSFRREWALHSACSFLNLYPPAFILATSKLTAAPVFAVVVRASPVAASVAGGDPPVLSDGMLTEELPLTAWPSCRRSPCCPALARLTAATYTNTSRQAPYTNLSQPTCRPQPEACHAPRTETSAIHPTSPRRGTACRMVSIHMQSRVEAHDTWPRHSAVV